MLLDVGRDLALQYLLCCEASVRQPADERREKQRHRREQKDRDGDFPVNCDHEAERADDSDDARE